MIHLASLLLIANKNREENIRALMKYELAVVSDKLS